MFGSGGAAQTGRLVAMNEPSLTAAPALPHWSSIRESGTVFGLRLLYRLHRILGRSVFRAVLWIVGVWYALVSGIQHRASQQYLARHAARFPDSWPTLKKGASPSFWHVVKHFQAFGEAILDKALGWTETPQESDFTLLDPVLVRKTLDDPRGQLVIGSHFGNLEYCRGFMQETHARTVNVLVHDRHSANFVAAMSRYSPDSRLNVFQVDELDVSLILLLKERLERGEWLFIAGDRIPLSGDNRTAAVTFLDHEARFPIGPYLLARTLACPVKLMFAWRDKNQVIVDLQDFSDGIDLPRKSRQAALTDYATRFADALETVTRRAPYQWFNFYPFWGDADS